VRKRPRFIAENALLRQQRVVAEHPDRLPAAACLDALSPKEHILT
jgi:hypothetical protein